MLLSASDSVSRYSDEDLVERFWSESVGADSPFRQLRPRSADHLVCRDEQNCRLTRSESFPSGSQRCASQIRENEESGGSIARRVLAEYRVQAVLTQVRLANMPGEGPTLGANRYSPEQGELVEQRASAVSDTGERIVANRDREVSLLV